MRLSCGCVFTQLPDQTVITVCGLGHRLWLIHKLGDVVEELEDVDIESGEVHKIEIGEARA